MSDADVLPQVLTMQADSADSALGWASLGEKRWRCAPGAGRVRGDKGGGEARPPSRE